MKPMYLLIRSTCLLTHCPNQTSTPSLPWLSRTRYARTCPVKLFLLIARQKIDVRCQRITYHRTLRSMTYSSINLHPPPITVNTYRRDLPTILYKEKREGLESPKLDISYNAPDRKQFGYRKLEPPTNPPQKS